MPDMTAIRSKSRQFFALLCISNVVFWVATVDNLDPTTHTNRPNKPIGVVHSALFAAFVTIFFFIFLLEFDALA